MIRRVNGGFVLLGDCADKDTHQLVYYSCLGCVSAPLVIADPPYGNIVSEKWDRVADDDRFSRWMIQWVSYWKNILCDGGAFYVWGGLGHVGFRPFAKFLGRVEQEAPPLQLANMITWKKRRAYGVQTNYLYTREECAYLVNGDAKKPHMFNVPLLDEKRGYAGYNAKYPAKSEYLRRSNVWTDVTEILRGKKHVAEKPQRVLEIPIEVHTQPGEFVIDLFSGSGATALAARRLGRRFISVENDPATFETIVARLESE
jgi:DNA modification methylase